MSQTEILMVFALGFLLALILAMLLARFIWNVGQRISRHRIARDKPALIRDLEADRDQLRASHAMISRKFESQMELMKARAVEQQAEVSRHRNRVQNLTDMANAQRDELDKRAAENNDLANRIEALEHELGEQRTQIANLSTEVSEKDAENERLASELNSASALLDESNARLKRIEIDLDEALAKSHEVQRQHDDTLERMQAERVELETTLIPPPPARQAHQATMPPRRTVPSPTGSPTGDRADVLLVKPSGSTQTQKRYNFDAVTEDPPAREPKLPPQFTAKEPRPEMQRMMTSARRALREKAKESGAEDRHNPIANVVAIAQRLRSQSGDKDE